MTSLAPTTQRQPNLHPNVTKFVNNPCVRGSYQVINTLKHSGSHALAGLLLGINPLAGAIIGGTSYVSSTAINWLCKKAHICQKSLIATITRVALSAIAGLGLGVLAAKAAGFSLTLGSVILLKIAAIGVSIAGTIATAGIVVLVVAAVALIAFLVARHAHPTLAQQGQRLLNNIASATGHAGEHAHRLITVKS
jgi:hypothetical protein